MADLNELTSTDSVKIIGASATGVETNAVNATTGGDLTVSDGLMTSGGLQGAITLVANTATELKVGASRVASRKSVTCMPTNGTVYWGYTSGVTVATGTPIVNGRFFDWALDPVDTNATVYVIAATAISLRVTESP